MAVPISSIAAVIRTPPNPGSQISIAGGDGSAITQRAEIFTGVEAERRRVADATGTPSAEAGTMRLCGVLNQSQAVAAGQRNQSINIGHLTEQMHRDNGSRGRSGCRRHSVRVDQQRVRQHIDEAWSSSYSADRLGRGDECVCRNYDLVARTYA
jgi:hypothetical protein